MLGEDVSPTDGTFYQQGVLGTGLTAAEVAAWSEDYGDLRSHADLTGHLVLHLLLLQLHGPQVVL